MESESARLGRFSNEIDDCLVSRRDLMLGGAAASVLSLHSPAMAAAPIRVSGLWLRNSQPASSKLNDVRGTLAFRLNGEPSDRTLVAYGAGSDWVNTPRQCVELVKRYAARLKVRGFESGPGKGDLWLEGVRPSMGHAKDFAKNVAAQSDGGLNYFRDGADALPRAGSIISFAAWRNNPYGHVGILCNHDAGDARTGLVKIKLFDQNMHRDRWAEVRFIRNGGRWWGKLLSSSGDYLPVAGWASPSS